MEPLDNPVWHALAGPQARFADGTPLAYRYQPDVAAFAGLPDEPTPAAWDALHALVGADGVAVLFRPDPVALPAEWTVAMALPTLQMVATGPLGDGLSPTDHGPFDPLGPADSAAMLDLVAETRPGPFFARTVELGRYLGRRVDGCLVAMAGVRMRFPGHAEISAVCSRPAVRRQGYGTRLVRAVAAEIEAGGDRPILHVLADNHGAIRLYETLGFAVRAAFDVTIVRAPSRPAS